MRLKRRQKDALTYYGFSDMLDATVTVFADEDNILHRVGYCFSFLKNHGVDNQDEGHLLQVKIIDIDQQCCGCLREEPAISKVLTLVERFTPLYRLLQMPVPSCTTNNEWESAGDLASNMDHAVSEATSAWFSQNESWERVLDSACDELSAHQQKVVDVIFAKLDECSREYGIASLLSQSSTAALELKGELTLGTVLGDSLDLVGIDTYFILDYWLNLIKDGVDVKDRHRFTMKMVGGALIGENRECNLPEDITEAVSTIRRINSLVLQLEVELAAALREEPKTFLVVNEVNPFSDIPQILAQRFTLRKENRMQLLAVPEGALHIFTSWDKFSRYALMPADEKVCETAVKMWDSNYTSVLFSPANLVDVAETLLEK